jgi:hypothetical protein
MNKRTIKTIAVGVGAGALVLGMAGPAVAAALPGINELPAKVKMAYGDTVTVTLTVPGSCDAANWTWSTRTVGQKAGATVAQGACEAATGAQTWTVTAANLGDKKRKKANAVVKFILTPTEAYLGANPEATRSVKSLVVKVNATGGKPATSSGKSNKPETNPGKGNKSS